MITVAIAAVLGLAAHVLKRAQLNGEGKDALKAYLTGNVIAISLSVIGVVGGLYALYEMEQLTLFAAFSAGYMADSIFGKIEARGYGA